MKRIASLALSLVLLLGCLPAAVAAEGPSSWTEEEVNRAVEVGLVPQSIQGDWQQPVTRGEFAMLVIRYLAVTYGRTDEQLVNDYMTCCPDRNGEFWGEEDFGDGLTWWQRFSDEKSGSYLTDLPTGEQRAYIQAAYHMGLVNGKGDGTVYDPEGAVTRQEAACQRAVWNALHKLGVADSQVRFRADTPYGTVLALEYSGMMQFYETLLFVPKDGQTVILSGQSAGENWTLSADQTTLTYTIDGTVHTADLTT